MARRFETVAAQPHGERDNIGVLTAQLAIELSGLDREDLRSRVAELLTTALIREPASTRRPAKRFAWPQEVQQFRVDENAFPVSQFLNPEAEEHAA